MKIYQCIHKYPPHIPYFEKKYGISDTSTISFDELRQLLIKDGYAAAYILNISLEGASDTAFYTIWDYERLQFLWAKENGLKTKNLNDIKLAQIEHFKPDVFYNHSPFIDNEFIYDLYPSNKHVIKVCWNGIIQKRPWTYPLYDIHLSLHRPYIEFWKTKIGLNAHELQPAIPSEWGQDSGEDRSIDLLFYGQVTKDMFSNRQKLISNLIRFCKKKGINAHFYLQISSQYITLIQILKFKIKHRVFPDYYLVNHANKPLYGQQLYQTIKKSKIVVNTYTDYNNEFKSNMRLFEAIGNGAFLISESGSYPDGFNSNTDFYTYNSEQELFEKIEFVLNNWPLHQQIATTTQKKISALYSKENQWQQFQSIIQTV